MSVASGWVSAEFLRALALALLHFLWQGAAIAAVAAFAMGPAKRASMRYGIGVLALAAMLFAPVGTFFYLQQGTAVDAGATITTVAGHTNAHGELALKGHQPVNRGGSSPANAENWLIWMVEAWFLGVLAFSIRTAGGVLALERLRRQEATTVCDELLLRCVKLQELMGVQRFVRYCESAQLDAPAVIGWLRPVVLLPFSALTGLSAAQLEAVIAHELAHIKRYDAFVNLFQVGVESVLFYHPAVWWLSKRIRAERENCCDDAAIAACGSPLEYARALTLMEEWRATPAMAMAANHGPLTSRVRRLIGASTTGSGMRTAGLAAGAFCLTVAVVAANGFFGVARATTPRFGVNEAPRERDVASAIVVRPQQESKPAAKAAPKPAPEVKPDAEPAPAAKPATAPILVLRAPTTEPLSVAAMELGSRLGTQVATAIEANLAKRINVEVRSDKNGFALRWSPPQDQTQSSGQAKQSYIDSMKAAGMGDLSVDDLIAMKSMGVTPEYIKSLQAEGVKVDAEKVIAMKSQGITPDYIHEMRALGIEVHGDELVGMKALGVTPQYIKDMRAAGINVNADDLMGMKSQGVTPAYVDEMKKAGVKISGDDLIGMKAQGVTPEYIREMRAAGMQFDGDKVIGMKAQGLTAEYVKSLQALGIQADSDEFIGLKAQGVTPEFVKSLQAAGFKVDADEAMGAKAQGLTPEFIEKAKSHGFKNLTLDKLLELKESGVLE
jgi:beta-lactamase regulating signal transducer with metallopeptidase domain